MSVKENLQIIEQNIKEACERSNRNKEEVQIIAVTKYVSNERAQEALEAGIIHLGENRDDGFLKKWEQFQDKPIWHFIGTLQSRKVKNIIDKVDYIHSLDRLSLAKEIQKRASKPIKCFVQVNVSGEESKHGLRPDELIPFIEQLASFDRIVVVGLMTMAPFTDDETLIRRCFQQLKTLQLKVQALNKKYAPCTELSMGMSNDYIIAVEEGATFVRIGSSLVGE
ncbi:YggS family pyridoxal phosphate-dependent enzyme [Aeribacillus pallidus]|jgi:PLP dependent protein|uniref:YggS family pyridoxal phosphate-dependent enzyme n=1 Tax=Aeribacillus pallidus TaxID=33936 RepID=UPI001D40C1F6|nr:YggS family pyridoxal phosphate-dependent enzyme [Bacillus sp. (in: firmicutes)]